MNFFTKKARHITTSHDTETKPVVQDPLLGLCQGDSELYDTMSNFLLLRPEEQIPIMGTTERLIQKANEAIAENDSIVARTNLEIAARIEIYKGNVEKVRTLLEKASSLSEGSALQRERTLLSNLQRAMQIAEQYYHQNGQLSIQKQEEEPLLVRA